MIRHPPRSPLPSTLFPHSTLFRSYTELFPLPPAQLKSRLGKQKSRHFCRMGHDGIMSARELQKAPVVPVPSIGSAGCRNREGGRGAVNEGCRTAVDRKSTRLNSSH